MPFIFIFVILVLPLNFVKSKDFCEIINNVSTDEVKYTQQKSIPVSDRDGHVIRIFKTETNHKNSKKNCEGLSLVKTDFFGISDYLNKSGEVKGYSIAQYDDGSKIFSNFFGIAQTPEDQSKNGVVFSTIIITGGTGIYKGVTGHGKGKTEFNPETGYSSGSTKIYYKSKE